MGTTGNRAFWARARGGPVTMEDSAGHQALPTTQRAQAIRPKSAAPAVVYALRQRGGSSCAPRCVQVPAGVCASARRGGSSARRGLCRGAEGCGLSFQCSSASPYGCTRISACPRPAAGFSRSRRIPARSASSSRRSLGCARARRGGFADSRSAPLQIGLWCARCARESARSC